MVEGTLRSADDVEECLFSAPLYQSELARVRFVLGAYVRARLQKLEASAGHVAVPVPASRDRGRVATTARASQADPDAWARLSAREQRHCDAYLALLHKHHRAALLSEMPGPFADECDGDACPEALARAATAAPPVGDFVFVRAKADLGDVQIDPSGETAFFAKGDVHVLRYEPIKALVHAGDLALF